MTPLVLQNIRIGAHPHQVGIFGCILTSSTTSADLLEIAQDISSACHVTFQLVNADYVVSHDHLLFATLHALTMYQRGQQRASTLGMEILRFAAIQRQISVALKLLGLTNSTRRLGAILVNGEPSALQRAYAMFYQRVDATDDSTVLEITSAKKANAIQEIFEISEDELAAMTPTKKTEDRWLVLQKLVYDRCALLVLSR